jgi:D-alanyl-D-alanine carboxypeptidase
VGTTGNYKIQVQDASVQLFPPAFDALVEAMEGAKEAGLEHFIVREGYRSVAEQEALFNEEMSNLSGRYTGNRLIEETKKKVNYPGTSDYHTGMTFRMDVYQRGNAELNNQKFQSESAQGAWLTENCWKYGIIFRFPSRDFPNPSWEDKSYKTGVSSQLNMYRFVGKAHSAAMKVLDMCLEEYVEFLIDHPHICIYEDGALVYEVVRIKGAGSNYTFDLPVPNPATSYQASFDNMDGVVMAYCYR